MRKSKFSAVSAKFSTVSEVIVGCSIPVTESGCWLWERSRQKSGYGDFKLHGKHHYAHRASYEAFVGPIPEGMQVCHRCDVRSCVRPSHLFVGTNNDNIADSMRKGRRKGIKRNRPFGLVYKKRAA